MKVFGNLMNRLAESSKQPEPEVGMGATILMFSDRHPATIVKVLTPRKILVQEDNAKRTDKNGMSESQDYTYTPNPKAPVRTFTRRKDGGWQESKSSPTLLIGTRDKYHDFSY
jgi:hypothetical protein